MLIAAACLFWGIDNNLTRKLSAAAFFLSPINRGSCFDRWQISKRSFDASDKASTFTFDACNAEPHCRPCADISAGAK
jgi:hypothetical protein